MEFTDRVVLLREGFEVVHLRVGLLQLSWWKGEELAPVRAWVERGEPGFYLREELSHGGPLGLPGEVDCEGVALISHAEPEVVAGDSPELGGEEVWGDLAVKRFDGGDCVEGVLAGDEVLCLELSATRGSEVHLEVWEALVPGAGDVHLRGAVDRVEGGDRVEILSREFRVIEEGRCVEGLTGLDAALDPELGAAVVLPVSEQAD